MRERRVRRRRAERVREKGARCVYTTHSSERPSGRGLAGLRSCALAEESEAILGPAVVRQEPALFGLPEPGEPRGKQREGAARYFWSASEEAEPERAGSIAWSAAET